MGKMRSPNYPAIGLGEAVIAIQKLWDAEKRTPVDTATFAKALGYNSISGRVRTKLAALRKYGLVEGSDDGVRISDLAMSILHNDSGSSEQINALREAALRPELFMELHQTHRDASDNALRSHLLLKRGFSDAGAKEATASFRDTIQVANLVDSSYNPQSKPRDEEDNMQGENQTRVEPQNPKPTNYLPPSSGASPSNAWVWTLSMPRNVRAELRISGSVTLEDVRRLKKQVEFLEETFDDVAPGGDAGTT